MQTPKAPGKQIKKQTKSKRNNVTEKWELGGIIEPVSISQS